MSRSRLPWASTPLRSLSYSSCVSLDAAEPSRAAKSWSSLTKFLTFLKRRTIISNWPCWLLPN